jgi:hypothetical protein
MIAKARSGGERFPAEEHPPVVADLATDSTAAVCGVTMNRT